jgi:replication factor A1
LQLYYITAGSLKAANKQFSNLNNDYELTFQDSTEVIPCQDSACNIPSLIFNFVKINDLPNAPKDTLVDVIGE